MENIQRVWIMYILMFSLILLTVNEVSMERQFILWVAKLNQCIYFKGILASKFGPEGMLLWKSGSAFVSFEDTKMCLPYRLIWLDQTRPTEAKAQLDQYSWQLQTAGWGKTATQDTPWKTGLTMSSKSMKYSREQCPNSLNECS